jgi:hypothetical protein
MSTTVAVPVTSSPSRARALGAVFITLAIVALVAVSFVIGRATASSAHRAPAPLSSLSSTDVCRIGRPC